MRPMLIAALGAALLLPTAPAAAQASGEQAQADALGNCFVMKSTGADRIALVKWMVGSLASVPQLKDVANVDPAKLDQSNKTMAALFTRLIAVDCAAESKPLLKAGNSLGFRVAGESLGRMAMQELLGNPDAERALSGYTKYLDPAAVVKLLQ